MRLSLLHEAVASFRAVFKATALDHPSFGRRLSNLLLALRLQAEHTGDTAVLVEVAELSRLMADTTPEGDQDHLFALLSLAETLQVMCEHAERSQGTAELAMLEQLVQALGQLKRVMPAAESDRAGLLGDLAAALLQLHERTGRTELAREAVDEGRQALEAGPRTRADCAIIESNLAMALYAVFERTGDTALLAEGVVLARRAVAATLAGHPNRFGYLANLAVVLRALGECTGQAGLLDDAVAAGRDAVRLIHKDGPYEAKAISQLAIVLLAMGVRTGQAELAADAVALGRRAVAAVPEDHFYRVACLTNLGALQRSLAEFTGQISVLEEAVAAHRLAVKAAPLGHPHGVLALCNLANTLRALFYLTDRSDVLREAAAIDRDALAVVPEGHQHRAMLLANLSGIQQALGSRTGEVAELKNAVESAEKALAAAPADSPMRAICFSNLANAMLGLFEHAPDTELLAGAVDAGRRAVAAGPAHHLDRGLYQGNLVAALLRLHERTGQAGLLEEAVAIGREAVAATPGKHPNLAGYQTNLGIALAGLASETGRTALADEAAKHLLEAAHSGTASALTRVRAHRAWAALPLTRSPDLILSAFEAAVGLLPQAVSRHLPSGDREHGAGSLAGLAAQAAAAATAAGRPIRAVELLEQSRGILIADTLNARSGESARLRDSRAAQAAGLIVRFEALQRRFQALDRDAKRRVVPEPDPMTSLDHRLVIYGTSPSAEAQAAARRKADADWRELLENIRSISELRDFLRLDQIDRLVPAACDGPVIYVYADQARCDALVLTANPETPVRAIPLPDLTCEKAIEQTIRCMAARAAAQSPDAGIAERTRSARDIANVLAWMWDTITGPILTELGYDAGPTDAVADGAGQEWPRVWWCPVGFLSYLPFHATGHHDDPASSARRTVVDRVISSYTPTARALMHARRQAKPSPSEGALIVAAPEVRGLPQLGGVRAEVRELTTLMKGVRVLASPTRAAVLAALPEYGIAHFACHAKADATDAGASRLILADHVRTPLTVTDIAALQLSDADLAYLSACKTTVTTPSLTDESVHITAAFQLAGYRRVIGTLWPISDQIARALAVEFYGRLTRRGAILPETDGTAAALHQIIRTLRTKSPEQLIDWASHVHVGI